MLYRAIVVGVAADCHWKEHLDFLKRNQALLLNSILEHIFPDLQAHRSAGRTRQRGKCIEGVLQRY